MRAVMQPGMPYNAIWLEKKPLRQYKGAAEIRILQYHQKILVLLMHAVFFQWRKSNCILIVVCDLGIKS